MTCTGLVVVLLAELAGAGSVAAQAPTGAITGTVTDSAGGVIVNATVVVTNRGTGEHRTTQTSATGRYRADELPPASYEVTVHMNGFATSTRAVDLLSGATLTVEVTLAAAGETTAVEVRAWSPFIDRERPGTGGVVTRAQIDALPLNGRNVVDLVTLEPGVAAPVRGTNDRLFVAVLGSGLQTNPRIGATHATVDGASIDFPGAIGASLNLSPEAVDFMRVSTANFDVATGLTTNGAISLITRSGTNVTTGRAFGFYRDHRFAAYPSLISDPTNPDPYFARTQFGGAMGGPLVRNRLFAFVSAEHSDQQSVVSESFPAPFAAFGGVFASPFVETEVSAKVDGLIGDRHRLSIEWFGDSNSAFAPVGGTVSGPATNAVAPSDWSRTQNRVSLAQVALTSVLSRGAVNEVRASYFWMDSPETPATAADCPQTRVACSGVGGPEILVVDAPGGSPILTVGPARTLTFLAHRYEIGDTLTWQHGTHSVRLGGDWQHTWNLASQIDRDPAQVTLFSPAAASQNPAILVPPAFLSVNDVLQLPLQSVQVSVGPGAGLEPGFQPVRFLDASRAFASDTWMVGRKVTISGGLAVSYEPNALNVDLSKPDWLAPLVGAEGLGPPEAHVQLAPAAGLTWLVTPDARTQVRVGAGRYVDPASSTNSVALQNERNALSPLGTTRIVGPVRVDPVTGTRLTFPVPTTMTGADFVNNNLPVIRSALEEQLAPDNEDYSVLNIDATKTAMDLSEPGFGQPTAVHLNVGIERQLATTVVIGADFVGRWFSHTFITGIDENLWTSQAGPVIPACAPSEAHDVHVTCSNGPITFDATAGRARYVGLLVHVERRLSQGWQGAVSYALSSYTGTYGTGAGTGFNNDNWLANDGPLPTDHRHMLNVSGLVRLPGQLDLAFNVTVASASPFTAYLGGVDLNGDGTVNDLLPGSTVGAFGRSLGRADLVRLVNAYNQQRVLNPGLNLPAIALPASYAFGDAFFTQDVRLSRAFAWGRLRIECIAEVFNLLNTRNYTAYDGNLLSPTFGQPTALASQTFGSGGPRAGQFGLRLTF